jgi:hypothetical protein
MGWTSRTILRFLIDARKCSLLLNVLNGPEVNPAS